MSMIIGDQTATAQLIVRDAPVPRMAPRGIPICGEGAMAAAPDRAMRHIEPTPDGVAVPAVGDPGLAPPAVLLSASAEFAVFPHSSVSPSPM